MKRLVEAFFKRLRKIETRRFHARGWASILDIPTEQFFAILASLEAEGWKKSIWSAGPEEWIDDGNLILHRAGVGLHCRWDGIDEGRIAGPGPLVRDVAARFGLTAVDRLEYSPWDS